MNTNEVIEVIKACKEAGVAAFEHGALKLSFQSAAIAQPDPVAEKSNLRQREFALKEEQLENLRLTDPLAYETLVQYDQNLQG